MPSRRAVLLLVLSLTACGPHDGNRPVALAGGAPTSVSEACALAGRRCSRCHSIERVERAQIFEPARWRDYVHRMRLMPSSGIPPQEEPPIVQCLVFRTRGQAGLDELASEELR